MAKKKTATAADVLPDNEAPPNGEPDTEENPAPPVPPPSGNCPACGLIMDAGAFTTCPACGKHLG